RDQFMAAIWHAGAALREIIGARRRDMVGTCTAYWALLTRGMAFMVGFLLLLWGGTGNTAEGPSEILIGATLPLSGRFTPMAGTFDRLCQSWAKLVNAQGGIYIKAYDKKLPVKFIIYDDKSEPAESAKFYERLVTVDKVHLLLGPFSSHITKAAVTVADKYKIPMVMAEANDATIFEQHYKYSV